MSRKIKDPDQHPREWVEAKEDHIDREFQFEKTGEDLEEYIQDIAETVRIGLDQSIAILTPWFFNNLPRIYYQTTPRAEKVRHLSAVITGHVFETKQTVELWDRGRSKVTYIGPGGNRTIITDMARKLESLSLKMGSLYFSRDKLLFLSSFFCKGFKKADYKNKHVAKKISAAKKIMLAEFPQFEGDITHYLEHLDHDFTVYATAGRLHTTFRMLLHMLSHEGAHTYIEPFQNSPTMRLTLGLKGIEIAKVLKNILYMINRYEFDIYRAFVIQFDEGYPEPICIFHFVLRHSSEEKISMQQAPLAKLVKALRTLPMIDSDDYDDLMKEPFLFSVNAANLIRSIGSWVQVLLGKENLYYYSPHKICQTYRHNKEFTSELVLLFRLKFDPSLAEERQAGEYARRKQDFAAHIKELVDRVERHIFKESLKFIDHLVKTNYFLYTRTGLAFRLAPEVLDPKYYPQKPFGIFFITGHDYRFFHVRWKNISRGGLRVVMPHSASDYLFAHAGLFDEVYGLSLAQQLKNKDIPEGGSKAVMLLQPNANRNRAVRGGINALLDLLVSEDESHEIKASILISYYPEQEIIYLGPDENLTNELIEWVPQQAERRGYTYAKAFMSSKPRVGINHKTYGVTSEGLNVFVDHMLRFLGIDPLKQTFTVKMTGGPNGDVAGNELKILYREYKENARITIISDGEGAAYDPQGLDWQELLQLVKKEKSINFFNPDKLHQDCGAFVIASDSPENTRKRNEFYASVPSDLFIPAGGRPYTFNEHNCHKLIMKNGEPSCRSIVEGANIFFTKEARSFLQERGVFVIKDSSANKTGVICSSYEVIASLILSDDEFLAIKDAYVKQVIEILRHKAALEANLLFNEFERRSRTVNLVDLSLEISNEINQITDILLDEFTKRGASVLEEPTALQLVLRHCPPILQKNYEERIHTQLPEAHRIAILASSIASHLVYQEGLGWLDSIAEGQRFQAAMTYMRYAQKTEELIASVNSSGLAHKDTIASILRVSAARNLTMIDIARTTKV